MTTILDGKKLMNIAMGRLLASAVILSWNDLTHATPSGLIQLEYVPGARRSYLKVWQLMAKGEWSLVCEYWMSHGATAATDDGIMFSNGYDSTGLTEMLEIIMQHWDRFAAPLIPGPSSIQIKLPTQQETLEANGCMRQAYKSLGRTFTDIPAVAVALIPLGFDSSVAC
jgi:hypothetical protein